MNASVFKYTVSEGKNSGKIIGFIEFDGQEGDLHTSNEVLEAALKLPVDTYFLKGSLSATPEMIEVIKGLNSKNVFTVFYFNGHDDIGILRSLKRNSFFADVFPTVDAPLLHPAIISLLDTNDEIKLNIKTVDDYVLFRNFLIERLLVRPIILFNFDAVQDSDFETLFNALINDVSKFKFQFRFSGHKTQMMAQNLLLK